MKQIIILKTFFSSLRKNSFRYSTNFADAENKLENLFFKKEVQQILIKITGLNYEKIFAPSRTEITTPKYQFVTDQKLKKLQEAACTRAYKKLQMPPVVPIREPIDEVLSHDPELQGYLRDKTIFTDISTNVYNRDRMITIREIDGTLRKATWDERQRMNQLFFPVPGRYSETPQMFKSSHLERLLNEEKYEFVLDCACVQFEPDCEEYHEVTGRTYEHIRAKRHFDLLRSTRHFGPMAFYFASKKNIDLLLIDMISRQLISDAADTIQLLYIMHRGMKISENIDKQNHLAVIEDYVENHSSLRDDLEMALQTFREQQQTETEAIV